MTDRASMATEPRPMDRERLAWLREAAASDVLDHTTYEVTRDGAVTWTRVIRELLADRDYQAAAERRLWSKHETTVAEFTELLFNAQAEITRLRSRVRVEAEDVERAGVTQARVEEWFTRSKAWARVETPDSRTSSWAWRGNGSVIIVGCDSAEYLADRIGWIAKYENRSGLDILDEMAAASVEEPGPRTSDPDYWDDAAKNLQLTRAKCEAWLGANGWVRATSPRAKAASEWRNEAMHHTVFLHDDPGLLLAALAGITRDKSELGRILDEMARMEVPK